jgi:hypothetical protein
MLRVRILSGDGRTGGVPLLEPLPLPPALGAGPGLRLDFLLEFGVAPELPLPLMLPESVLVCVFTSPRDGAMGNFSLQGILSTSQPHHVVAAASLCLSSLLRSNVARYRSYDSRNDRSTREENMSSPRGLVVGGIDGIVVDPVRAPDRVGEDGGSDCDSSGRGKKNARGFRRSFERSGGLRTFRYILNDRRALFACGTYLRRLLRTRYVSE